MDKEKAKQEVEELVKEFLEYSKEELSNKSENQIKSEFIDPLFEALGWDMRKDAEREERILKGRADYILRIGNQEGLVIEAKKTSVALLEEEGRQAVSYAYHRKIKFAVLTNFKNLRVYHALSNIKNIDKNLLQKDGKYFKLEAKEFIDKFDLLWLLSRESFENKEIDKLLSSKEERLNKPIDKSILDDLLQYREWLSKDLKSNRAYLTQEQIDEIVQILINRLIFMRSVEDRGLEEKDFLLNKIREVNLGKTENNLWALLKIQFKIFDKEYNSRLFSEGLLEKEGFFDENTLSKVIKGLYYGTEYHQERYMFDEIPGDLLGSIYEQYLGTILKGTEKRVKLESGSGKRKKMGIYYTPSYIVDYIVKNTVGEYIKNKTIDEILEVKILDPACGSGSFLIRAFSEVCNAIEERLKKGESSKILSFQSYKERLTLPQKALILQSCIYGVDLDEKAVELTQLNLLLKVLEEETRETRKRILPNLKDNIKNGNSLIDDPKVAGDKAFNWHAQFQDVFRAGGFDVVIGNPPYIRIQEINKKEAEWLTKHFEVAEGYIDTYMLFTELSIKLIKKEGFFSFIMPSKFMSSNYGRGMRKFILNNCKINKIVDFGDLPVFESATTYPGIYIFKKSQNNNENILNYIKISDLNKASLGEIDNEIVISKIQNKLNDKTWNFGNKNQSCLLEKLEKINSKLESICDKIFQGLITSADKIFILHEKEGKLFSEEERHFINIEKVILKKLVKGLEIKRYQSPESNRFLIFPYKKVEGKYVLLEEKELELHFPKCYNYLLKHKNMLKSRTDVKNNKIKWYSYSRPQNLEEFEKEKLLTPFNAFSNSFTLDLEGAWFFTAGVAGGYGLKLKNNYKKEHILAILNSKLIEFFIKSTSTFLRGGYFSYENRFIKQIPIKLPYKTQEQKIISLVNQMLSLQKQIHERNISGNEKERLEQQIKNIDYEIDEEVYKLYGITEEEKKIIEESLK